ncbi:unnamed protein product [Bursaphelenchus xylophilus]|uniref:(pine wood nematode) hypothetical protein n=1 Tax=Bursaphelenchus xylophilus TaxID=6326 RepID=A0A1I7RJ51_BURXY|nr:unnamed protein product [Bursaphelenchus xylophilus]CAG9119355.1 unnamed protein product [Bursaphelenchus xylophilus]
MHAIISFALFATIAAGMSAQDMELNGDFSQHDYRMLPVQREMMRENVGETLPTLHFLRSIRRSRELFGKRSPSVVEEKRRSRELFGKRSAKSEEEIPFNSQEVLALATLLTERPRRARGTELFGK